MPAEGVDNLTRQRHRFRSRVPGAPPRSSTFPIDPGSLALQAQCSPYVRRSLSHSGARLNYARCRKFRGNRSRPESQRPSTCGAPTVTRHFLFRQSASNLRSVRGDQVPLNGFQRRAALSISQTLRFGSQVPASLNHHYAQGGPERMAICSGGGRRYAFYPFRPEHAYAHPL